MSNGGNFKRKRKKGEAFKQRAEQLRKGSQVNLLGKPHAERIAEGRRKALKKGCSRGN